MSKGTSDVVLKAMSSIWDLWSFCLDEHWGWVSLFVWWIGSHASLKNGVCEVIPYSYVLSSEADSAWEHPDLWINVISLVILFGWTWRMWGVCSELINTRSDHTRTHSQWSWSGVDCVLEDVPEHWNPQFRCWRSSDIGFSSHAAPLACSIIFHGVRSSELGWQKNLAM